MVVEVAVDVDALLRDREAELTSIQELAHVGTWQWEVGQDVVVWSPELCRIFDEDEHAPAGRTLQTYLAHLHPEDRDGAQATIEHALSTRGHFDSVHRCLKSSGALLWIRSTGRVVCDDSGHPQRMVGVCQDITEQKLGEARLTELALHDSLTGLPNRWLFSDRLTQGLQRLSRRPGVLAVMFLDLDRFKPVNDRLGHAAGDQVLLAVATRLSTVSRPEDTIARFGGDEFAVLCEDLTNEEGAIYLAKRILASLKEPVAVEGERIVVSASIGIVLGETSEAAADALLRDADTAMYKAKAAGRNCFVVLDQPGRDRAMARLRDAEELRRAVDHAGLRLYYQPDVDLESNTVVGVEALVRWQHPVRGLIGPDDFISLAEDSSTIVALGEWVLAEACSQLATWDAEGRPPLTISVNLSARQLTQPSLIDAVCRGLGDNGIEPKRLCLEITESVLMEDVEMSVEALLGLRTLGVRVAIDDFGTGYSSLSYLRRFPVDVVKIDRSFVTGLGTDPTSDAIVAAVVNLSHALGLRVVAEGVENAQQLLGLRALRCDRAQGYYWSAPAPAAELERWLDTPRRPAIAEGPVDLLQLLTERTQALRSVAHRPVVVQAPPKLAAANADRHALKVVLDHLLGNAVTYSQAGQPVVVGAASDRHWVRVSVTDFGEGMTAEESARCFEQFWQADRARASRTRGTGMGLHIVRTLIEAMGGHVGVKSARDKGSTFTIALPRSARAASRPRPSAGSSRGVSEDTTIREFMRQIGVPSRRGS